MSSAIEHREQIAHTRPRGVALVFDWRRLLLALGLSVLFGVANSIPSATPSTDVAIGHALVVGLIADSLHHPNLRRYKFLVVGHTSSTGDAKHNLDLSQKRANAITEALSTTFAVAPDRLFAIGVGEEWPVDPANPKAADNRRVQLVNLGLVK